MADEKKVSFAAKISRFFKDLKGEMKKIVWPSKKQIINNTGIVIAPVNCPGPTALIPEIKSSSDYALAVELVCSYSKYDRLLGDITIKNFTDDITQAVPRPYNRVKFKEFQIC